MEGSSAGLVVASCKMDKNPLAFTGGGPRQGMAVIPAQRASMGMEEIFSNLTCLPSASSLKPSSKSITQNCIGTSYHFAFFG